MNKLLKNWQSLFKIILLSYLNPKSKKKFSQRVRDVYLPNMMKSIAVACLLLTILVWMGINSGLQKEYRRFKKDPYTTSIFVSSNRFFLKKEQIERIKLTRFDPERGDFNIEGRGEEIYTGDVFPFSSLDLFFYAKDSEEVRSLRGRTVSQADQKMLLAVSEKIIPGESGKYDLTKNWQDNERDIIVSKYLLERLGCKEGETVKLNRLIDKRFQDKPYSFKVPVNILAVADRLPYGDFIVSEEFDYNRKENTFNPFDMVERFYVFTPPGKETELEMFLKKHFKYIESIIRVDQDQVDNRVRYEVVFKSIPFYKEGEFKELRQEAAKFSIVKKFENSGYECQIDYFDWKKLPVDGNKQDHEFLTLYLKEMYIDSLDRLSLFFREGVGGIEMDDTVLSLFENYHRDMRRFRKISFILYVILIGLGIFVSIAVYIKSVQATMHRLGVFSAFGVSANFLSTVLAVESVVIFLFSMMVALLFYSIVPPFIITKEITMSITAAGLFAVLLIGSILSFIVVFYTVKSMLKEAPYSLMDYRS